MLLPAALRHLALISDAGVSTLEGEVRGLVEELSTALDALEKANAEPTELEGLELAIFARDEQLAVRRRARGGRQAGEGRRRRPLAAA